MKSPNASSDNNNLRQTAETLLSKRKTGAAKTSLNKSDILRLIHELEVHQIELEIQNEELMQARAEMEAALIQYTNLYDFAPTGYITLTRDGIIQEINLVMCRMLGLERAKLNNRRFGVFIDPGFLPAFNNFIKQLDSGEGKKSCELALNNNAEQRWVHMEATCFEGGELSRITIMDINERKRAEQNTQNRVTELELLYESGLALNQLVSPEEIGSKIADLLETKMKWHHVVIRTYDPATGKFKVLELRHSEDINTQTEAELIKRLNINVSKPGEGLSGLAFQNSQIIRCGDLEKDKRYATGFHGMHSGLYVPMHSGNHSIGVISIESKVLNAFSEGDERLASTLASQAAIALENASLFEEANKEINERKKVEALLDDEKKLLVRRVEERTADLNHSNMELTKALQSKDEFLASMSHELRTPLTGILGIAESLQLNTYGELKSDQAKAIKNIEDSGLHLLELINDILDMAKVNAGMLEVRLVPCSLEGICQSSLQLTKGMAQQRKQLVTFSFPDKPIMVNADGLRLKQALVNLLSNAIKFTQANGELGLDVKVDEATQKVILTVWDKGIGIKAEDKEKLFKPFTQIDGRLARQYSGTGLGLSLVHHLIDLHNGSIHVESIFGQGSRFSISLPML